MQAVETALNIGADLRANITKMLGGSYSTETKCMLLAGYFDIILEHHESIVLLVRNRLFGSAFALIRPLFETLYRAFWVNACASENQIERIRECDTFRFPELEVMVSQIDTNYSTNGFFKGIKINSWKPMCSYAHSGLLQVSRRFKDGDISPNYEEGEILEVLNGSNMAMLIFAQLFFVATDNTVEAHVAENMILQYGS